MTEQEWLQGTDPEAMLEFLKGKASDRKLRLFACACCRAPWIVMTDEERAVIDAAEMFADGRLGKQRLTTVSASAEAMRREPCPFHRNPSDDKRIRHAVSITVQVGANLPVETAAHSIVSAAHRDDAPRTWQVATVRCVFGNPFGPVTINPSWLSWHDGLLVSMAQQMYDSRDFSYMPVLADALEEAGCTNRNILGHCRSGSEHFKGCWVVDRLLGKS